jgi:hypothetical protein
MIISLRMNKFIWIRRFILSLLAMVCLAGAPVLAEPDWDWEVRCCLTNQEKLNVFLITLVGNQIPVAEIQLITPNGQIIGYNQKNHKFYPPTGIGVYASSVPVAPVDQAEWDKFRDRNIILKMRVAGLYSLKVFGVRPGSYHLTFKPGGAPQVGPGARNSLVDRAFYDVKIQKGEVHTYQFQGTYDSIYDGGLPHDRETAFRVQRIE